MRRIAVREPGGPEVLHPEQVPDPEVTPGHVLVRVRAAGVNFIDTYQRSGLYPLPAPVLLGQEGAGDVLAVGEAVGAGVAAHLERLPLPGDRVAWAVAQGSYAELALVAIKDVVPIPDDLDYQVAAAAMLQGLTAHYLVTSTYPVQHGDVVLLHAAAGGVGQLLSQLAAGRGARVLGTVSTAEKETLARQAGCAEVIRYDTPGLDLASAVRSLTSGFGVHVVYDGVGAATFDAGLAALRRRGTMVLFGAASGPVPPVDLQRLSRAGSVYVTRPKLGDYLASRAELLWRVAEVFDAVRTGRLVIRIGARYPLAEAAAAHVALEGRQTTGKVLLIP
jgi:NADPH2:quinone reductase